QAQRTVFYIFTSAACFKIPEDEEGEKKMNILVVPSGFKECLNAERAADCIERGIKNTLPTACITAIPMTDGGEGFTETMVNLTEGELHYRTVTGPIGQKLEASIGILGDTKEKTAVIE